MSPVVFAGRALRACVAVALIAAAFPAAPSLARASGPAGPMAAGAWLVADPGVPSLLPARLAEGLAHGDAAVLAEAEFELDDLPETLATWPGAGRAWSGSRGGDSCGRVGPPRGLPVGCRDGAATVHLIC
jgi:hypothetical protein